MHLRLPCNSAVALCCGGGARWRRWGRGTVAHYQKIVLIHTQYLPLAAYVWMGKVLEDLDVGKVRAFWGGEWLLVSLAMPSSKRFAFVKCSE